MHNNCDGLDWETTPVYRGGNNFDVKPGEVKIDKNGLVKPTHGVSVHLDPKNHHIVKNGGAFRIVHLPDELKIIQRGTDLKHHEIVPKNPMTLEKFQQLLQQIIVE